MNSKDIIKSDLNGDEDTGAELKLSIRIFHTLEEQKSYYLSEAAKSSAEQNFRIAHELIKKVYNYNPDAKPIRKITIK